MTLPFLIFKVSGNSMLPKFKPGQKVVTFNWFINPKVKDVVVARQNDRVVLKRIEKIENDKYFLVGDNLEESSDSRKYGPIARSEIIGKVI